MYAMLHRVDSRHAGPYTENVVSDHNEVYDRSGIAELWQRGELGFS